MGLLQDITGGTARRLAKQGQKVAGQYLQSGYDTAGNRLDTGYTESNAFLEPYAQMGLQGQTAYTNALLGTPEQKQQIYDSYMADPGAQGMLGLQSNAALRQLNAGGSGTGGGKLALAGARIGAENWGNWMNRLQGLGAQGAQMAGNQADLRTNYANNRADLDWNYAGSRAGNYINGTNARAQASQVGLNNLLNIAGTAAKAVTAFSDVRLKRDIVRVGALPSGLPVYHFRYIDGDELHQGVMAQEALMYAPQAVEVHDSGYLMVKYHLLV